MYLRSNRESVDGAPLADTVPVALHIERREGHWGERP